MLAKFSSVALLLISVFVTFANVLLAKRLLNPELWWWGLFLTLVQLMFWRYVIRPGFWVRKNFDQARLSLNFKASSFPKPKFFWPFEYWFFFSVAISVGFWWFALLNNFSFGLALVRSAFQPDRVLINVECPSYLERPFLEKEWTDSLKIQAEDACLLSVSAHSVRRKGSDLRLVLTSRSTSQEWLFHEGERFAKPLIQFFPKEVSNHKVTEMSAEAFEGVLELSWGKDLRKAQIEIKKSQIPSVQLESLQDKNLSTTEKVSAALLFFKSSVHSQIPLKSLELKARTRSGYQFQKMIAEFANTQQKEFSSDDLELNLFGVPFAQEDTLFVRAVAYAVIPDVTGLSQELEFAIQPPGELRQQLVKELESALQLIKTFDSGVEQKKTIVETLEKSLNLSSDLAGRRGVLRRLIDESIRAAQQMQKKQDRFALRAQGKIEAALRSLKRENVSERQANFFTRLQALKGELSKASPEQLPSFVEESLALKRDVQNLKNLLRLSLGQELFPFEALEKESFKKFLDSDHSEQNLQKLSEQLRKKDKTEAFLNASQSYENAKKTLGSAISLLQSARARSIKEARSHLQEADKAIGHAKVQKEDSLTSLRRGQKELGSIRPGFGKSFEQALQIAKNQTQKAHKKFSQGKKAFDELDEAQQGIVKALLALEDEEQSDRESQQNLDGQNFRSLMDAMALQSEVDASWRDLIQSEILRLRAAGEPFDSQVLRYLEGLLK